VASDLLTKLKNQQNATQKLPTVSDINTPNKIILGLFIPTNELEITNQILKLKNGSSPGLDGITVKLLKENKLALASPLKHIYNLSFLNAIVPDLFKMSTVTPIFKKGDTNVINNYRPISMIKKTTTNRYFEIIDTKLYNEIPPSITNLPINVFKKSILQWLLDSPYEYNV